MEAGKTSGRSSAVHIFSIPVKLPGLNDYTEACRKNRYAGNLMKKNAQATISWFMHQLPEIQRPVRIRILWQEAEHRRDPDNVAFGVKFILDELVRLHKIPNDSSRWIKAIYHDFTYGTEYKITIYMEEA